MNQPQQTKPPTPAQQRYKAEVNMIFYSLAVQAVLTISVVGFSCYQLSKPNSKDDAANAVYVSLLTGALGYWFPSPANTYISTIEGNATRQSNRRKQTGED